MNEIKLSEAVWGDIVRIFADDEICLNEKNEVEVAKKGFFVTRYVHEEFGERLTFEDCVSIAKENGFTEGVFYIMAETPLEGTMYQYANCYDCDPFVSEYGKTRGYA